MSETYAYTIHAIPPSNNRFMGNSNNFNLYRKEKEHWHWLVKAAIGRKPKTPIKKAAVYIRYFFPDRRRRDPDNYSGKMLLDPLVREGVLQDDSFRNIELVLSAGLDSLQPRTEITVVPLSEDSKEKNGKQVIKREKDQSTAKAGDAGRRQKGQASGKK